MIDPAARRELGTPEARAVARWYHERGFAVSAESWRCRDGEIDLVVRDGRRFVFCEFRDGALRQPGSRDAQIARHEQMRLRRLAARWLEECAPVQAREIRFDVASVRDGEVEVIEGAF